MLSFQRLRKGVVAMCCSLLLWVVLGASVAAGVGDTALHITVATADYLPHIVLWAGSLQRVGVPASQIIVYCVGRSDCSRLEDRSAEFSTRRLPKAHQQCVRIRMDSSLGCEVGAGKALAILSVLHVGETAVLYDVDVYVYQDIWAAIRSNRETDLYVSSDRIAGKAKDSYNLGFLVARPRESTIFFWQTYLHHFLKGRKWDQAVFGKLLASWGEKPERPPLKVIRLPDISYGAVHLEVLSGRFPGRSRKMVTMHATCIEGENMKRLVVFSEYGRSWVDPWYAHASSMSTVVATVDGGPIRFRSIEEADLIGRTLLYAAKVVHGKVRLANIQGFRDVDDRGYRILSAERFANAGVEVVEHSFWAAVRGTVTQEDVLVTADAEFTQSLTRRTDPGNPHEYVLNFDSSQMEYLVRQMRQKKFLRESEDVICAVLRNNDALEKLPTCLSWCDAHSTAQDRLKRKTRPRKGGA